MTAVFDVIVCPLCKGRMHRDGISVICENGHSYDVAKCGYVNLLPPGKEKNSRSGDEREMVRARVDFLARRRYDEISRKLGTLIAKHTVNTADDTLRLCDMGSGEGYHTVNAVKTLLGLSGKSVFAVGFDASKYASECASKLSKSSSLMPKGGVGEEWHERGAVYFFPANIFSTPTADSSFDAALSMFAPVAAEESLRILKKHGKLIVVSSARDHLTELRHLIYDEVRLNEELPAVPDGFSLAARDRLTYKAELESRDEIKSLFVMTPFYYKTTEAGRERLLSRESLTVTVDVNYSVFEAK